MIELWIPITILGALLQCLRTALQKHLATGLSTNAATWTRFVFAFPIAIGFVLWLAGVHGLAVPDANPAFLAYVVAGSLSQILATSLLIKAFAFRNFAVATTYSKTEAMQTALFGILILGELIAFGATAGIAVSLAGIMLLSLARSDSGLKEVLTAWTSKPALIGIASGSFFALSAVFVRASALSLDDGEVVMRAALTLASMTVFQAAVLGAWLAWREPGEIAKVFADWQKPALVSVMSVVGSACWFVAMTMQTVAYVRTLGQIELVFTFLLSYFVFRERTSRTELSGIALIIAGLLLLLHFR